MRFLRLGEPGTECPAVRAGDQLLYDLRPLTRDLDGAFLTSDGLGRVRAALADGSLPRLDDPGDGSGLRVGAPIAQPGKVICLGVNYHSYARVAGAPVPTEPVVVLRAPDVVVGPYDEVLLPRDSSRTDWEVELGVVIGRTARYLAGPEEALDRVAGYVLSHDVTEREFQLERGGGQWGKGKSCETFNPLGPWLVPAGEVRDPQSVALRLWVNGELRQESTTAEMVFGVAEMVWRLSWYMVLRPGDLINTGTPAGVGMTSPEPQPYLRPGDVVELEATGLGRQRQHIGTA
ncbi:2-hydroxyhepta-2,4-diene-1,7-dioate isomerase [Longimycelium tulufanense]|uniref:2-hydroxyhepta-2,4-diene-1,7-dioate isomerase n=1 Tax=Longimycelium tulufanense TaxID=907463 RepID=A0A8J3CAF6_9PSEU|nr:fumarylacetoacetate hydrolase family protein [Longimycelium tulufanense]GGM44030.1 2-hydroxyhepta-2,4-diene-1,7-dioate isomerase [Longimycelium tulufanense]